MLYAEGSGFTTDTGQDLNAALVLIGDKITSYFHSLSYCRHDLLHSQCRACKPPALTGFQRWCLMRGYPIKLSEGLSHEWRIELESEYRSDLMRYFARNKVEHFDPTAYSNPADSSTTTAQSFSRRPLRFGGDDRVLSDQHKHGSRADRASQKHHETDSKGETKLHKFYGAAEQIFDKSKPRYKQKLEGNRIRIKFAGNYHPAPNSTPIPRGDHYMER